MRGVLGFLASASGVCAEIGSSLVVKMRQERGDQFLWLVVSLLEKKI